MAPPKRKSGGGRTTPKGTRPGEQRYSNPSQNRDGVDNSSRYTPPVPQEFKEPKPWIPYVMVALFVAGIIIIMVRNLIWQSNLLMAAGFLCLVGGLAAATKWR